MERDIIVRSEHKAENWSDMTPSQKETYAVQLEKQLWKALGYQENRKTENHFPIYFEPEK